MNVKKYIASGVLEQYVLGNLITDQEIKKVEAIAAKYPGVKIEINNIEYTLEQFARLIAIKAPREMKQVILNKIDASEPSIR